MAGWALFPSPLIIANNCTCGERGISARRDHAPLKQSVLLLIPDSLRSRDGLKATRGVRLFCFAKLMEKVPPVRAQPWSTKVRDIRKLRYSSAQIGFSAGYQHRASVKVARRGRCSRDFA